MDTARRFAKIIGIVAATATAVGILMNLNDVKRYVRISRM